MVFKDQLVRCGACGKTFVYTVREQRSRAERGLSLDPPAICPECRGADVRLAEAASVVRPAAPAESQASTSVAPRGREPGREGGGGSSSGRPDRRGPSGPPRGGGYQGRPGDDRGPRREHSGPGRGPSGSRGGGGSGNRRPPQNRGGGGGRGGPPGRGRPAGPRQTELRIRHLGTVKWFDGERGFGFIAQDEDSSELFVHTTSIIAGAKNGLLQEGQPVEYEIERTPRGLQAVDVVALA